MKVRILKPVAYDGRREIGEVLEMDEATASAFGPEYVEVVPDVASEEGSTSDETDTEQTTEEKKNELKKHTKDELKALLQERGIVFDEANTKEELINLLIAE